MSSDQIMLALQALNRLKTDMKEIKKDMHDFERVTREDYDQLKKAYKDLRGQMKSMEEEWRKNLLEDAEYNSLRELKMQKDEELAEATTKLFTALEKLPKQAVQFKLETEGGPINIQIQPEMRLYVNGKEEKKRG